ncbi:competence/damage-inducible protein A [Anaerosinus massiliensis]|uniref:competence/damage-inducible protein A n=1 Tax=Massilibacillus massiliensis TaxID=1806837 RepID=UPI000A84BD4A|nr:competence/damage-inducible protein A [Massilibacillus massiliensis]
MIIEIVTTGTELLLGQIVNTNSAYLAKQLNKLGLDVLYQTTVGDNRQRMTDVLKLALQRADIVITSGGLGPTQGDITKLVTASLFDLEMKLHQPSLDNIEKIFSSRGRQMTENNIRQAMIPDGAFVLDNACGTAPGIVLEHSGKVIINLPGPPHELKDMFMRKVVPYLSKKFGCESVIVSRVLNTFGIGESLLEEKIEDLILNQGNPTLALLARPGEVIVRITAKADTNEKARALIGKVETEIRKRIGQFIFAVDDGDMEEVVGKLLTDKRLTIACAESCTGGLLTSRLTDVSGSSNYVYGSVVSYTNEVKKDELHVKEEVLQEKGAVSEEVAIAMAEGILHKFHTHIGIGITGIAGPEGGSEEKPVGLVYIAITGSLGSRVYKYNFNGDRKYIKYRTSQAALDIVRHYVQEL